MQISPNEVNIILLSLLICIYSDALKIMYMYNIHNLNWVLICSGVEYCRRKKLVQWREVEMVGVLERLLCAKMESVQVPWTWRKDQFLESPRNHTNIGYQAFMKIIMDLGVTDPSTISSISLPSLFLDS